MMDIKILVATHKKYWMSEDNVYLPLHVGREGKEDIGFTGDNTGENISSKNNNYCELTGLYWAWKNLQCDYIGLCHYRRYFAKKSLSRNKKAAILSKNEYEAFLKKYDVLVPEKRNYYIDTVRSQYEHIHYKKDLDLIEEILKEMHPEYMDEFRKVMSSNSLHIFNMFVMSKNNFEIYCQWLFPLLFELEKRIDTSGYSTYQARAIAFLSERLFNVWLAKQKLSIGHLPIVFLEKENWFKKIFSFLKRKYGLEKPL